MCPAPEAVIGKPHLYSGRALRAEPHHNDLDQLVDASGAVAP